MRVYNFFKFISEKKPEYPINTWGPKVVQGTIKDLKPVEGQGKIDIENGIVSGWFVNTSMSVTHKAYFNEGGELLESFSEIDTSKSYGKYYLLQLYPMSPHRHISNTYYENFLLKTFEILAGVEKLRMERYVPTLNNISFDDMSFDSHPIELFELIGRQIKKHLESDESELINDEFGIDLSGDFDNSDLTMLVGYSQEHEDKFPEWFINLRDYIMYCVSSCLEYEADITNTNWFTGISPNGFDGDNNIESIDYSKWPIMRLNLSGNQLKPYYNFDKELVSPYHILEESGIKTEYINEYLENFPYYG